MDGAEAVVTGGWWYRRVGAGLLGIALLAGCQSAGSTSVSDAGGQRATRPALSFSVTRELEAAVIRRGASAIAVEEDLGRGSTGFSFAPLAGERFALLSEARLAVIDADGRGRSISAEGCSGVAAAGTRVLLLCPGRQPAGGTYIVRVFDARLNEMESVDLRKVHERTNVGSNPDSGTEPPTFLAAGEDAFWVYYTDRLGFARGGSRLIVKHDYQGHRLSSVRVDGSIYADAVSPDGRFVGLFAGGSGGACHTVSNLRVVDLSAMRSLNVGPDTPAPALAEATGDNDVYFTGTNLRWVSSQSLVAEGTTAHHDAAGCDVGMQTWRRTVDVNRAGVTDERLETPESTSATVFGSGRGWVGPGCDDVIESATDGLVLRQGGQTVALKGGALLYGAEPPAGCPR